MANAPSLVGRHHVAKTVAALAMQERKGLETDIDKEIASYDELIAEDERTFMGKGTPPPDYLTTEGGHVWRQTLENASDKHFKLTEYDILAQYCWMVSSLKSAMSGSALLNDKDELTGIMKVQAQSRALALRLRLSPTNTNAMKTQDRVNNRKAMADEMKALADGKNSGKSREGMMFGQTN